MRRVSMLMTMILLLANTLHADEPARPRFDLWPDGAPGAKGTAEKDRPSLEAFLPANPNGCAVVVCPGGGYGHLAVDHEGKQIGEWFNSFGVTAFVLRYRLAPDYQHPAPLNDVQRAIRTVRARAGEWKLDPQRVGVMGFSAGGHLASTAATHFDAGNPAAADPIDKAGCRPDFAILCYPVITFTQDFMHRGSRNNLLGKEPDPELVKQLSNELQVTPETPPTFLFHTHEDAGVPPQNSAVFYLACVANKVPAELHIYEKGRHGIGLGKDVPGAREWSGRLRTWLETRGYLAGE